MPIMRECRSSSAPPLTLPSRHLAVDGRGHDVPLPQLLWQLLPQLPTGWRNLTRDSETDPRWHDVYRRFAVISPWTVGRYTSADNQSPASVDKFLREYILPDMAAAKAAGADYLPVVFPGDSAHYEPRVPPENLNHCPRNGGNFLWRQLWNALGVAKADMRDVEPDFYFCRNNTR